jgi:hypothetical protein
MILELIILMNLENQLMNRMDYIKELQKAIELISEGTGKLDEATSKCSETGFRLMLNDYLMAYAKLNYDFSTYLIMKLTESYIKDKDDAEFKRIIKQLEDENGKQG